MANLTKRIIDLQTTSTLGSDDYVMVDGATNGTKKYLLKDILDEIEDIKDGTALETGAVTTDKLAAGAVTTAKIADDAVTAAKIDDGAVGTDALAANAVTGAKIATGAVGTGNIASGAVTLDKIAVDSLATTSRNGLMSSADKTKLNGFSAASNYALKSDIAGAYIFKGSVNTENNLPSTGLTVGDVYNIIAASSYGESGANVAWTGTAWDALGESFNIGDGAIDTEQLADDAVTNDKLADEAKTTVSLTATTYTDPTYGSGTRQGYEVTFGNSDETVLLPSVDSELLIDVENIPAILEKNISDGAVTANKLGNGSVGTLKIADGAVTSAKLGSDVTTTINSKAAASDVTALSERVDEELENKADIDGYYPSLSVGRADALTGIDETSQWATRESTGSGTATVRSVQGATVVWNQLNNNNSNSATVSGVTFTKNSDGSWTTDGTATADIQKYIVTGLSVVSGHHYLVKGCPAGGGTNAYSLGISNVKIDMGAGGIYTIISSSIGVGFILNVSNGQTLSNLVFTPQLFDLTLMFGAGNEPTTVAEFERMYPEAYYPYSAPTLKPVQIAGIKSVGFNLWDEQWELGTINGAGEDSNVTNSIRSKGFIQIPPSTSLYVSGFTSGLLRPVFYDSNKTFISFGYWAGSTENNPFTTPSNARFMRFYLPTSYGVTYKGGVCINISNPTLNGQYKPYTTDNVEWPTQTLRAAGSVRDELTADELVTRVGVVDLGTLSWTKNSAGTAFYANVKNIVNYKFAATVQAQCPTYTFVGTTGESGQVVTDKAFALYYATTAPNTREMYIKDTTYEDAADLKASLNGVLLFYELATPATTPIDPALPMTYRVEQGGTESIIVPDGEISAVPVLTVAEGESAADLVMNALACIAAPDGPTATSNHAVGTYLTMGGKLYKVTTAIAAGETITAGTNVTQTTVMDELIALTQ